MADTKDPSNRTSDGRFGPGNKMGTGRLAIPQHVREMLEAATPKAVQRLVEALDADKTVEGVTVPDHDMRTKAAEKLLDRRWGKPAQAITNEDGSPIRIGIMLLPEEKVD